MTDYRCPSCDGGFPAPHSDECPWCGEPMDGSSTTGNAGIGPILSGYDNPQPGTFGLDAPAPGIGGELDHPNWSGDSDLSGPRSYGDGDELEVKIPEVTTYE